MNLFSNFFALEDFEGPVGNIDKIDKKYYFTAKNVLIIYS